MRRIRQSERDMNHYDPENRPGDCFRACVASLLDLPLSDVPHFFKDCEAGQPIPPNVYLDMQSWFAERKLYLVSLPMHGGSAPPQRIIDSVCSLNPGNPFILTGQSHKGWDHAVIIANGKIWHDPTGMKFGLHGPQTNGFYVVYSLAPLLIPS